jgi:DNA-binding PucR family transcriptional regulator
MIERGARASAGMVLVDDHLAEIIVLRNPELAAALVQSRLAAVEALRPHERERLLETLGAWLGLQRHTPAVAEALHVHPQTVRYRLGKLRELLGETLETPDGRFELELARRAAAPA